MLTDMELHTERFYNCPTNVDQSDNNESLIINQNSYKKLFNYYMDIRQRQ